MASTGAAQTILIVDDDEILRERLARAFRDRDLAAVTAADYESALAVAADAQPQLAVVDLKMPGRSGLELTGALVEAHPNIKVVVLTGYGSIATAIDAVRMGATYYVNKPADVDEILAAFERGDAPPMSATETDYAPSSLDRVEWEHIQRVLADTGGNVSEAARRLGLHRRTLQRKLNKYPPKT